MGFLRLKYSALSVFIVTLSSSLSGTAASQELSARDIPKIILTYYDDESKFVRDYLGKTFTSMMFFHSVGGEAFRGGYLVGFDGKGESAGLTCNFSESLPDGVIYWQMSRPVALTGIVYKVVLSNLYLERCEFG
jgi:hypothetical protein